MTYEVIVGNIGRVFRSDNEVEARECFVYYVEQSYMGIGKASGESVILFWNDKLLQLVEGKKVYESH